MGAVRCGQSKNDTKPKNDMKLDEIRENITQVNANLKQAQVKQISVGQMREWLNKGKEKILAGIEEQCMEIFNDIYKRLQTAIDDAAKNIQKKIESMKMPNADGLIPELDEALTNTSQSMESEKSLENKFYYFVTKTISIMVDRIDNEVPQSGKFTPVSVSFSIPLTDNKGCAIVEPSLTGTAKQRRLKICVFRNGSNRTYSTYLCHDTNEKIKEYLRSDGMVDTLIKTFQSLSESVDNDE